MCVSDYFREWLSDRAADLERSTYEAYTVYFGVHICPYFDELGKDLETLVPLDIHRYVIFKRKEGRADGKGGLSAVTVRKHLNVIKQAFREAVLFGLIPTNPAEPVKVPNKDYLSDHAKFISLKQAKEILAACMGHPIYPVVYLTLLYGLRRSEVLGLRWSAIDFTAETITICHTVVKFSTIEAKDRTKTRSSWRTFPLLPEVAELLKPLCKKKSLLGYVFTRADGSPLRPDTLTRSFQRILRRHHLPVIRFHDLRHATASILFDMGWSVPDVQHWLGHSDIDTTMNIYAAYNSTRKLRIGGSLERIFVD